MKAILAVLGLGLAALAIGAGAVLWQVRQPLALPADGLLVEVSPGTGIASLAARLEREGVLRAHPLALRIWARLTRGAGVIKAGEYRLVPGVSGEEMLVLLRAGRVVERTITFVEGWTFAEWRGHLTSQPYIHATLTDLSNEQVMVRLGIADLPAEGQFFPDTYRYVRGETDESILSRAHDRMTRTLAEQWRRRAPSPHIETPYEALILASIVEKESGYPPDRPKIARVFMNRLEAGMRLQSDPTVIYGIQDFDGDLTRAHLREATPFNTYVVRGLPPTPICNPGLDAIVATLDPVPGPWRYFVGRGDGRSEFSVTLDEHNAAVVRFQKAGRVQNYRSAPPPDVEFDENDEEG